MTRRGVARSSYGHRRAQSMIVLLTTVAIALAGALPGADQEAVQQLITDLETRLEAYRAGSVDPAPSSSGELPGG